MIAASLPRLFELLQRLPHGLAAAIGRGLGTLAFHVYRSDRRRALNNVQLAFPGSEPEWRREVVRQAFVHWLESAFETLHFLGHLDDLARRVRWVNRERLLAAAAEGRGLLVLTSHFGNYGLLCMALAQLGLEPAVVGRPPHDPETVSGAFSIYQRDVVLPRLGMSLIVSDQRPAAQIAARLRAGGTVLILGDFPQGRARTTASFLGLKHEFATGSAEIAKSTGAAVVQMLARRDGPGAHTVAVEAIYPVRRVQELVDDYAQLTEDYVLRDPAQWLWFHRAWNSEARP